MNHSQAEIQQAGEWMKGFLDTTLSFYRNMKQHSVVTQGNPAFPEKRGFETGGAASARRKASHSPSAMQSFPTKKRQALTEKGWPAFPTKGWPVLPEKGQPTLPAKGRPAEEVFEEIRTVCSSGALVQHPRCFACVPSPVSPYSWMGDLMTNAFDHHAGCWANAPGAGFIERSLIEWMCGLAGYPENCGGIFVSGGSMANLTALTAARDARLAPADREQAVAYLSDQTHSSVIKGLHIIGFRQEQLRILPSDDDFRMDPSALAEAVQQDQKAGKKPFAVVATAGTTNTGSIDPLPEIAAVCRKFRLWMHVDGAYGASLLLSEQGRRLLSGIELSDSISWDAHKWMMQTYGCSVVLVRDQKNLLRSFSSHPEYLSDAGTNGSLPDFWDLGPELTRPARALKLWTTLQIVGTEHFAEMIDHGCRMARFAQEEILKYPGWQIVSPAGQGVVCFRYAPEGMSGEECDTLNVRLAKELSDTGYAQILTTQLRGRRVLRMCTPNPETDEEDIRSTIALLNRPLRDMEEAETAAAAAQASLL